MREVNSSSHSYCCSTIGLRRSRGGVRRMGSSWPAWQLYRGKDDPESYFPVKDDGQKPVAARDKVLCPLDDYRPCPIRQILHGSPNGKSLSIHGNLFLVSVFLTHIIIPGIPGRYRESDDHKGNRRISNQPVHSPSPRMYLLDIPLSLFLLDSFMQGACSETYIIINLNSLSYNTFLRESYPSKQKCAKCALGKDDFYPTHMPGATVPRLGPVLSYAGSR